MNENGNRIEAKEYSDFVADSDIIRLDKFTPKFNNDGYYIIRYSLCEK